MAKSKLPAKLLVPFGSKDWQEDRVQVLRGKQGELEFECPVSHVVLDTLGEKALRLNSDWYRLYDLPTEDVMSSSRETFEFIRAHMPIYCDIWEKYQAIFLDYYFDFIDRHAAAHETELAKQLRGLEGLYHIEDWLLSAYLPLPQANLRISEEHDDLYKEEDMVHVPLFFWTGKLGIVILFSGGETAGSRQNTLTKTLSDVGIEILILEKSLFDSDRSDHLDDLFTKYFGYFWQSETLPSGPFKPTIESY